MGNEIVNKFTKCNRLRRWRVFNIDLKARDDVEANYVVDPSNITSEVVDDIREKVK